MLIPEHISFMNLLIGNERATLT